MNPTPEASATMDSATIVTDPDAIRQITREVLSGPDYVLDPRVSSGENFLGILLGYVRKIFLEIVRWAEALFDISPFLGYTVILFLSLSLLFILGHVVYTAWSLLRTTTAFRAFAPSLVKEKLAPEQLERDAESAEAKEDYITAVRLLFRASLLRIEEAEEQKLRAGLTNRELLRKFQRSPVQAPLRQFVEVIDAKWYGFGDCRRSDFESCREAHARIRASIKGPANA